MKYDKDLGETRLTLRRLKSFTSHAWHSLFQLIWKPKIRLTIAVNSLSFEEVLTNIKSNGFLKRKLLLFAPPT